MIKMVGDIPNEEEQKKVPTGAKRAPTNRSKGGQKRNLHKAGRTMSRCKKSDLGRYGGGERGLCLTSCNVFEVVPLVRTESVGKGDRVLSFIHCSHAT